MPRRDTVYVIVTIIICSFVVAFVGQSYGKRDNRIYDRYHTLGLVIKAVQEKYVDEVDLDTLMDGAIHGVMDQLDPHSTYYPAEVYKDFLENMKGSFGGLGIEITLDENKVLTVVAPIEDTPAYHAGVMAGDRIIKIEGEPTKGMTTSDAVKVLRGEPGTKVTITVIHPSTPEPRDVTITRANIKVGSIKGFKRDAQDRWDYMLDATEKIGYIRVTNFQEATVNDFSKAVEQLLKQGMKSLVLDLRNNPGGYLRSAINMSDRFLDSGDIVSIRSRFPEKDKPPVRAHKFDTLPNFDLVVLINKYSASASEIVSGAIQDNKRGVIIGERSFGKGTVQTMIKMEGGDSAIKLTTAKYFLPSGRSIQRDSDGKNGGVLPNIEIIISDNDMPRLWNLWRKQGRHVNSPVKDPVIPGLEEDPDNPFVDTQLKRAVNYLKDVQAHRNLTVPTDKTVVGNE